TIYNGVNTEYFKPINNNYLREKFQLDKETLVLTTISRFNKEKGHSFLIEGINELKNYFEGFKLLLVGDGEEENFIKQKVDRYNLNEHIMFLGYREDILQIL